MKHYHRTGWYGWNYLFMVEGSVIPRCIPVVAFSMAINALISKDIIPLRNDDGGLDLTEAYTFQLIGLVVGYLTVYRVQLSYNRYWEGVTMVKNMHSKWADACGQVIAFDRSRSSQSDLTSDAFCCHVVRLFSQMSAMATMRLHIVEPGEALLFESVEAHSPAQAKLGSLKKGMRAKTTMRVHPMSAPAPAPDSAPQHLFGAVKSASENSSRAALGAVAQIASLHNDDSGRKKVLKTKSDKVKELAAGISAAERRLLLAAPEPVFASAQRIQRAVLTRMHAGGMQAPPPIISRIFQEISNGLLAYNNATKMKEIPVPFAYVQLNAWFTNLFAPFVVPIAVASMTNTLWLSVVSTGIATLCYYALFIVANQLEDPFGAEANDMPMIAYHEEFCAMLVATMTSAWLPEDQWLVASGKWVRPRTVGLAANAFFDSIGSKNQVHLDRSGARPVPHDTVLNRSKASNMRTGLMSRVLGRRRQQTQAFPAVVNPDGADPQDSLENDMATIIQRASRAKKRRKAAGCKAYAPDDELLTPRWDGDGKGSAP